MRNYSSATKNIPIIYYSDNELKIDMNRFYKYGNLGRTISIEKSLKVRSLESYKKGLNEGNN